FCVRADPEPHDDIAFDDAERAMPKSDPGGINRSNCVHMLEAEASVLRVLLETTIGFTSPPLNVVWKPAISFAEAGCGPRNQSASGSRGSVRPARYSSRASSASFARAS